VNRGIRHEIYGDLIEAQYGAYYGTADIIGDIDGSGALNDNDITPFVTLLTGGGQAGPEPMTLALLPLGGAGLLPRRR